MYREKKVVEQPVLNQDEEMTTTEAPVSFTEHDLWVAGRKYHKINGVSEKAAQSLLRENPDLIKKWLDK